jgi:fatty-acid desaturase
MDTEEDGEYIQKSFRLSQLHLNYLDNIDRKNSSRALRQILDKSMQNQKVIDRRMFIDRTITLSSLGFMLIILSYLFDTPFIFAKLFLIIAGTFIVIYITIGGLIHAVQVSKKYRI